MHKQSRSTVREQEYVADILGFTLVASLQTRTEYKYGAVLFRARVGRDWRCPMDVPTKKKPAGVTGSAMFALPLDNGALTAIGANTDSPASRGANLLGLCHGMDGAESNLKYLYSNVVNSIFMGYSLYMAIDIRNRFSLPPT